MTLQELTEINDGLQREKVKIETLTAVVVMMNRLLEQHFLSLPPPPTMERTGKFLEAACFGLTEMLRESQLRSQALALRAMVPPTNGASHA